MKSDLMKFIWPGTIVNENNLNTHLYNIRKKTENWDYEILNHRTEGFWLDQKK